MPRRGRRSRLGSFSLGLDRPSSAFLLVMFPPCLSFPRFGSRNPLCQLGGVQVFTNRLQVRTTDVTSMFTVPPQAVPHRLFVTPRRPALFRPDAPASFMRLPIGNNPRCRRSERRRLLSWGIGQKKAVSFQERGFQQSASETALRGIWPRFPWASRRR